MTSTAHTTLDDVADVSSGEDEHTSRDVSIWQWDSREDCEVRQILDRIADKWSLLAVALLDCEPMRFSVLKREIDGISQRMLTRTLRHLERDGIVERTVHPTVPPQVEYSLTSMGRSLHQTVEALVRWTEQHQDDIARARYAFDARASAQLPRNVGPAPGAERATADGVDREGRPGATSTARRRGHPGAGRPVS